MVALSSLPYPIATFMSQRVNVTPKKPTFKSSVPLPSPSSKLTKRKNYLRPKILKTLTKPFSTPLSPPNSEDPIEPIEPNLEVPLEPTSENLCSSFVEESETSFGANESGSYQLQCVQAAEAPEVLGFKRLWGRMIFRIISSFVGLFFLQTIVAVWVMGSGDEKDRNLGVEGVRGDYRLGMRKEEVGLNGNTLYWANMNVDESEMEAKIAEIRKMAKEVREIEKKKSVDKGEANMNDDEDDDDNVDNFETGSSRIRSGIVKEVDGRLTKLRRRSPAPVLSANFFNKGGDPGKDRKNEGSNAELKDNMLMFEMKDKFRSHLNTLRDKPKGFQSNELSTGIREKHSSMDDGKPVQRPGNASVNGTGSSNNDQKMNVLASSFPERSNIGSEKDVKIPGSQISITQQASKKGFGSNSSTRKLKKGINGSNSSRASKKKSQSNSATKERNKGIDEDAKPKRGAVQESSHGNPLDGETKLKDSSKIATQDSRRKMNDQSAPTTSKMHAMSQSEVQSNSRKLGSKLSIDRNKDKQLHGDPDLWWLTLPYVLVILMQKGPDSEGQLGFYTIRVYSDAMSRSYTSYTIAFEDRNDAMNFSYLLESVFEDLPDATVDVVPFSTKELKEVVESLNNEMIVVKKGELQLYAGQPLADVESALRSLVK